MNLLLYYGLVIEHSKSYFQCLFAQRSVVFIKKVYNERLLINKVTVL